MKMVAPINMNIARGSLAVASFLGAGSIGGGAAMFAGGKTETTPPPGTAVQPLKACRIATAFLFVNSFWQVQPIPWATSDYYISVSSDGPILDLAWFNLSVPRFDPFY